MTIGPRPDGYPQKIPTMGRVKPRFQGFELESGYYANLNGYGYE